MDLLALQPGILLLAYNDDSEASKGTLVLALSTDEGRSWHDVAVLEADPRGSFHYPTLLYQKEQVCLRVSTLCADHLIDFTCIRALRPTAPHAGQCAGDILRGLLA